MDFENKISKISSWDKVKCVDDTCMWARSIEAACAWFDLCAHNGITLNPKKFQFAQDTVDFAELSSTPTNVRPSTKLLDAMRDFPTPTDISGTRVWFGLVNQGTNAFAMMQPMKPFVRHRITSVANPHANCRAELAVKTVKRMLMDNVSGTASLEVDKFQGALLMHRNTVDPETKASPALSVF